MKIIKYIFSLSFLFSVLSAFTITVTATKNDDRDRVRFFNYNNTLSITVTESGSGTSTGRAYYIMCTFSGSDPGAGNDIAFNYGAWVDLQNHGVAMATIGGDLTHTFTINYSTLTSANSNQNPNGKWVDFAVIQGGHDGSPAEGEQSLVLVVDVDGEGTADNLTIDGSFLMFRFLILVIVVTVSMFKKLHTR